VLIELLFTWGLQTRISGVTYGICSSHEVMISPTESGSLQRIFVPVAKRSTDK
jgi:hypothetical protein